MAVESEKEGACIGHTDTSEIRDVNVLCKVYSTMQILLQLKLNVITLTYRKEIQSTEKVQ